MSADTAEVPAETSTFLSTEVVPPTDILAENEVGEMVSPAIAAIGSMSKPNTHPKTKNLFNNPIIYLLILNLSVM
jgi:hypothetical protein